MSDGRPPDLAAALVRQDRWDESVLERHTREVSTMLEKEAARLKREKRIMQPMFIYLTVFCAALMVIAGYSDDPARRMWFAVQACFWFIFGAMILLRYNINRVRIELMAELIEIQKRLNRSGEAR